MTPEFLAGVLTVAAPLMLAALGGVVSERAGVVNIALEGIMLAAAFGYTAATWTLSPVGPDGARLVQGGGAWIPWAGMAAGIACGVLLALLHAFVALRIRANQVVSGIALNILAIGATQFACALLFDSSSNSSRVASLPRWGPGAFSFTPAVWAAFLLVPAVALLMSRTVFGLRLRAVGEHPAAAETLGVRPGRIRTAALALSGALAGLGGVVLAADVSQFVQNMTAGRGYIALAAVIFGKWNPWGAAAACLLFAVADKMQVPLQGKIPPQLAQSLPYLLTILVLAGFVGQSRPPAALGKPHETGR